MAVAGRAEGLYVEGGGRLRGQDGGRETQEEQQRFHWSEIHFTHAGSFIAAARRESIV